MEDLNHQQDELQVQPAPVKANFSTLAASLPAEEPLHRTAAQLQGEAASSGPTQLDRVGQQPLQPPQPPPQALQPPQPPAGMQALLDSVDRWPAGGLQVEQIQELMSACAEHLRDGEVGEVCLWIDHGELQYERSLGSGSFGLVNLYIWRLQGHVAVKWMNLLATFNPRDQVSAGKSFVREVLHLAQLDHPHVVKLHGLTWDPKQGLGIVLEYAQQGTLSTVLATRGLQVTPQQRLAWALQVADAMQYLHTRSPPVVHRDLKSDNILIDEVGNAKLADFGISLELHQTYLPINTNTGTVGWAAPEAVRAAYKTRGPRVLSTCTKECDVYSYGLLLGVLATGKDPWEGWHGWDVMLAVHQGCRLRPPEGLQQPGVHDLIGRCLDEQPTNRPGFGAVLEALSLLQPEGIIPSGTWPDPVPGAMQLPAARAPARAPGETASMSQAEGQGGGRQLPPAPPQARSSVEPSQLAGQQHPTAPSTPQPTQPHAPIGGSAPGSSITGFMQSLLDAVGRWPERLQGAPYTDLLEACMLKMREKFDGFWIDPEQLKLGRVVGGGGFAVVLQAEKAPEGQQVALKQFHVFRDSYERTLVESFIKEVCLLSQLKHKNIVALHHFTANLQEGWLGIVLEWAGDPLAGKLGGNKWGGLVITPQQLWEWAVGVAEGLEYLHGHDPCVVHRGLTSMDVMINQHGQVKLIDLGISQVLTHTHLTVNQACSLSWSAPELLSGGLKTKGLQLFSLVSEKYDIYSFGLCLGVMATHSEPWEEFEANTYQVAAGFHQGARLDAPHVQQPWLQQLIQQCMREEPGSRPAIGDVLRVLRQHSEEGIVRSPAAWPVRWPPDS